MADAMSTVNKTQNAMLATGFNQSLKGISHGGLARYEVEQGNARLEAFTFDRLDSIDESLYNFIMRNWKCAVNFPSLERCLFQHSSDSIFTWNKSSGKVEENVAGFVDEISQDSVDGD
jgi:hypothetical protein